MAAASAAAAARSSGASWAAAAGASTSKRTSARRNIAPRYPAFTQDRCVETPGRGGERCVTRSDLQRLFITPPRLLLPFRFRLKCPRRATGARHVTHEEADPPGWPVRPDLRARRLWRRVRRAPRRQADARDRPPGDRGAREPGASRRGGRRPEHRRRRRDPAPAARRVHPWSARGRPPAPGRLRGLRLLPAPGRRPSRGARGAARAHRGGRGPARGRLARRPGRQGLRRHHRQLLRARTSSTWSWRRPTSWRPTRTPSSASCT